MNTLIIKIAGKESLLCGGVSSYNGDFLLKKKLKWLIITMIAPLLKIRVCLHVLDAHILKNLMGLV